VCTTKGLYEMNSMGSSKLV